MFVMMLFLTMGADGEIEIEPQWENNISAGIGYLDISNSGKYVAIGSYTPNVKNETLYLIDGFTGNTVWTFDHYDDSFDYLRFTKDERYITVIYGNHYNSTIATFSISSSNPLWSYTIEGRWGGMIFSYEQDSVFLVDRGNSTIIQFNLYDGTIVNRFIIQTNDTEICVLIGAINNNSQIIFSINDQTNSLTYFKVLDTSSDQIKNLSNGRYYDSIYGSIFNSDLIIARGYHNNHVNIYNVTSQQHIQTIKMDFQISGVAYDEASKEVIVSVYTDGVYSFPLGENHSNWNYWVGNMSFRDISLSKDGRYIFLMTFIRQSKIYELRLLDREDGSLIHFNNTMEKQVWDLQISPYGKYALIGGPEGVMLFNISLPPDARILGVNPNDADINVPITFTGWSIDRDGTVVSHEWYSSIDGLLSNKENFTREDLSEGDHIISYRVMDNEGVYSKWRNTTLRIVDYFTDLKPNVQSEPTIDSLNPGNRKVTVGVHHLGTILPLNNVSVEARVYLSLNWTGEYNEDFLQRLNLITITGIQQTNETRNVTFTWPDAQRGCYIIVGKVDPDNLVVELDETNNLFHSKPISIEGGCSDNRPDLKLGDRFYHTSGVYLNSKSEGTLTFKFEIINSGPVSPSESFKVGFLDSNFQKVGPFTQIVWNDTKQNWRILEINSGEEVTLTTFQESRLLTSGTITWFYLTMPIRALGILYDNIQTASSSYGYYLVVDLDDSIDETDENNNLVYLQIKAVRQVKGIPSFYLSHIYILMTGIVACLLSNRNKLSK